jgi:hypothetical protein
MYVDALTQVSSNQAITGTVGSEDYINLQALREISAGEPLALVVNCKVALNGGTLVIAAQVDSDTAFGSATTIATFRTLSAFTAGEQVVLPLPPFTENVIDSPAVAENQYLRALYTLGANTATVDAQIMPLSMVQHYRSYPDALTISA